MVIKEILNRRSVREYEKRDVPQESILEIIKAGQFAPRAHGNQAVEFLVIKNQETKDKIFNLVGQEFVKEAPVLIIPIADLTKTICPVEDLSAASENMLLEATALGLGSVWKAIKGQEEKIKELLGIPKNFTLINLIPIGYPKEKTSPYSDKDFDEKKIHYEQW